MAKNWAKFLQKMASLKLRAETKRWGWQLKLLRLTTKISDGAGAGAGCGHLGFRLGTGLKAGAGRTGGGGQAPRLPPRHRTQGGRGGARAPRLPPQHRTQGGRGGGGGRGHLGFRLSTGLMAGAGRMGGGVRARAPRLPPRHRTHGGGGGDEKRQRGALPLVWVGWVILWLFWRGGRVFWARERARVRGLRDRLLACARCCIARGFGGMCRARG